MRLGNTQGEFILRCNGTEFTYATAVELDKWHHIGFSTNAATLGNELVFVVDGTTATPAYSHTTATTTTLSNLRTTDCFIGKGIDGKLDNTITWSQKFGASDITAQSNTPIEPGIGKAIRGAYSRSVDGLWKYDQAEDLCRDS